MKQIKKNLQLPSDYQFLLHLSDIRHWKKLQRTIAEAVIKSRGFYSCVIEDKKVVVIE
ncbi:MAG: hypothetical protein GYA41_09720 [Bacteroidales bacterium]|nr:hypothetical protein [Bacteroidales bacterium]